MLLPRLLFDKPARGGLISRQKLEERIADFARGEWMSGSRHPDDDEGEPRATVLRRKQPELTLSSSWGNCLQLGKQALERADLAAGNDETLRALRWRPARPQDPTRVDAVEASTV